MRGVLIATHARRHRVDKQAAGLRRGVRLPKPRRSTATAASVTRKVDSSGSVCFAGASYRVGSRMRVQGFGVGSSDVRGTGS